MGWFYKWGRRCLAGAILFLISTSLMNGWIIVSSAPKTFRDIDEVPQRKVGLLLGTSPFSDYGLARVQAAADLYEAGKIEFILVSGDSHKPDHYEVEGLSRGLVAKGVPESALLHDPFGLRTLDSIVRAKENFGCNDLIIISQKFHNHRAIFLARHFHIDAVGYNAGEKFTTWWVYNRCREYLAGIKAWLDLYILNTRPAFDPQNPIHPVITENQSDKRRNE